MRTSRDGVLVVVHDATIDRVSTGRGAIDAMRWAQLQAAPLRGARLDDPEQCRMPRREDVLRTFAQAAMNIDLVAVSDAHVADVFTWIRKIRQQPGSDLNILLTSSDHQGQEAITSHMQSKEVAQGMSRADLIEVLKAAWLRKPPIERLRGRACQMPAHIKFLGLNVPLLRGPLVS